MPTIPASGRLTKEEQKKKYWIKSGIRVQHKYNMPGIVMTVQRIERYEDRIDGQRDVRHIMRGVICSWRDNNGQEHTSMFRTDELKQYEGE